MNALPFLDGEQLLADLETLGQIGAAPDGGGLMRIAFGAADWEGRRWVAQQMHEIGLQVSSDAAGNTIGVYPGREALPAIAIGSHTDTVPGGGVYDGALGVLAGLACLRALHAANQRLRHPVVLINFTAEEATMAGGTLGSYAMTGLLNPRIVDQAAWDGQPVRTHLQQAGLDPARLIDAHRTEQQFAAFLELHIEQGARLEAEQYPIGLVEGIVGIRRYLVTFHGYANHAGTTTMERRQDALVHGAADAATGLGGPDPLEQHDVRRIRQLCEDGEGLQLAVLAPGEVATVGVGHPRGVLLGREGAQVDRVVRDPFDRHDRRDVVGRGGSERHVRADGRPS